MCRHIRARRRRRGRLGRRRLSRRLRPRNGARCRGGRLRARRGGGRRHRRHIVPRRRTVTIFALGRKLLREMIRCALVLGAMAADALLRRALELRRRSFVAEETRRLLVRARERPRMIENRGAPRLLKMADCARRRPLADMHGIARASKILEVTARATLGTGVSMVLLLARCDGDDEER